MTVKDLHSALMTLLEADPFRADVHVRFGPEMHHVDDGIVTSDTTGLVILSLAPIKLDQLGGF